MHTYSQPYNNNCTTPTWAEFFNPETNAHWALHNIASALSKYRLKHESFSPWWRLWCPYVRVSVHCWTLWGPPPVTTSLQEASVGPRQCTRSASQDDQWRSVCDCSATTTTDNNQINYYVININIWWCKRLCLKISHNKNISESLKEVTLFVIWIKFTKLHHAKPEDC